MKEAMPQIVGNHALRQRLCRDILSSSLSHAYILEGADGSGRHTLALMAAAALACEKKQDSTSPLPCGVCPSCKKWAGASRCVPLWAHMEKAVRL